MTEIKSEIKPKRKRQKPGDRHYVNNKEFYADMVRYDAILRPAKIEYAELLAARDVKVLEGMRGIEKQYKTSIESGDANLAEAKETYEGLVKKLEEENFFKSWYVWRPIVPDDVAKKILLICQRLRYKPNFINYSYVDEMVLDAIENCIRYACKFNIERSENPFSYFTTIANNAFIRRIKSEQKLFHTKARFVQQSGINGDDFITDPTDTSPASYTNTYRSFLRDFYDIDLPDVLTKKARKSRRQITNPLVFDE